jgi:FkbM family methyltransferase
MFDLDSQLRQFFKNIEPDHTQLYEYYAAYQLVVDQFGYDTTISPGQIQLLGWNLEYRCGAAFANFIDQILVRRLNDFIPENDHPLILDCGANIGFSSLSYKRQFPNARIIAFEPDPEFAPLLKRNLERNGAGDVQIVDAATWVENGNAQWHCEGIDGSHLSAETGETVKTITVHTVDLRDYLNVPVDLIKMDIEGAEFEVINHIAGHLEQVKAMSIECHINQTTIVPFAKILQVLSACGFKISINSFSGWRDLLHQSPVLPDHHENYILVSAWRNLTPQKETCYSWVPIAGITPIRDFANLLQYINQQVSAREAELAKAASMREAELAKIASGREDELAKAASKCEAKLVEAASMHNAKWLNYLQAYALCGEKALQRIHLQIPFQHEIGNCWVAQVKETLPVGDNEENSNRSILLLFEDGKLLQSAHALHEDIRTLGGGRYSHWHETLYFSTSDNSDPNTNGREYRMIYYV